MSLENVRSRSPACCQCVVGAEWARPRLARTRSAGGHHGCGLRVVFRWGHGFGQVAPPQHRCLSVGRCGAYRGVATVVGRSKPGELCHYHGDVGDPALAPGCMWAVAWLFDGARGFRYTLHALGLRHSWIVRCVYGHGLPSGVGFGSYARLGQFASAMVAPLERRGSVSTNSRGMRRIGASMLASTPQPCCCTRCSWFGACDEAGCCTSPSPAAFLRQGHQVIALWCPLEQVLLGCVGAFVRNRASHSRPCLAHRVAARSFFSCHRMLGPHLEARIGGCAFTLGGL